ncbi:MAG TPA: PEP-CTERM sorting domain-containing protein [Terriglobales bacterium]|jgi:hypothetical protein|nr:PEP-CTERM sorting domain-containing protein [Terriglobales bacterium]
MKTALLVGLLLVAATAAYADPIDPGIIIGGGTGSFRFTSTPFSFAPAAGNQCQFTSANFTGGPNPGPCVFINNTGFHLSNLTITATLPVPVTTLTFFCGVTGFFAGCNFTPLSTNTIQFFFFGGPGINSGCSPGACDEFLIDIYANQTSWPAGTTFTAVANVPEPGTVALVATGLGALVARRRRRKGIKEQV